jgi:signal transduction histidine kinase
LLRSAQDGLIAADLQKKLTQLEREVDLAYLFEEIPRAISQSLDGISRASGIVKAMKTISQPASCDKQAVDINQIIRDAATVSASEWKLVAELSLDLADDLPLVPCYIQEFSQVLLNLLINAAQAIGSVDTEAVSDGAKGTIVVSTRKSGDNVEVSVADSGCGIPEAIQDRVFEPFFTTKEIGKGTGQGLAIAYSTVIDKHDGQLNFRSRPGEGTTFFVKLPLQISGSDEKRIVT